MKNSLTHLLNPIINKFNDFRLVIFIVGVAAGLIFCVLTLSNIIQDPPAVDTETAIANERIDQNTINRLNKFKPSNENTEIPTLPSGRINPFSE